MKRFMVCIPFPSGDLAKHALNIFKAEHNIIAWLEYMETPGYIEKEIEIKNSRIEQLKAKRKGIISL